MLSLTDDCSHMKKLLSFIPRVVNGIRFASQIAWKPEKQSFAKFGKGSILGSPTKVSRPQNISIGDHCTIDAESVMYAINKKIIIKKYFVAARGLHISTGTHERRVGKFLGQITEIEKNHEIGLDADVIINEDVWAGFNVSIMKGVIIGRGCTLAAGAVVTHSTPPYSIWGGVPARHIKFYWSIEQIMEHEAQLYPKEERFTKDELVQIFKQYEKE